MKRQQTIIVTYNYFEPGTYVVPASRKCELVHEDGSLLFEVMLCYPGIVYVRGRLARVLTEHLREATPDEIEKGDWIE